MTSTLADLHRNEGARLAESEGIPVPRHYGDPTAEYRAAIEAVAVADRSHRVLLVVSGRAPGRMMTGVATGTMPPDPAPAEEGLLGGRAEYSLILTPKGKVVTDLRMIRLEPGEEGALLLDLPSAGAAAAREHFSKYMPPRFAKVGDPDEPLGLLTVVGPGAAETVARALADSGIEPAWLEALEEGDERVPEGTVAGRPGAVVTRVIRAGDLGPPAFDVLGPVAELRSLWIRLRESGASPMGLGAWETLRIEKGRPAFGAEMDSDTLPPEAGVQDRAIDHAKGCYTGQEVIVRIRDRGRVNRRLRGLLLGEAPAPEPGTPIFVEGRDRPAGEVRSVAQSPLFGQGIALGYVRREAEPPATVRLGAPDGPEIQVRALSDTGWVVDENDSLASPAAPWNPTKPQS